MYIHIQKYSLPSTNDFRIEATFDNKIYGNHIVHYLNKSCSIFIQTDKPTYKPGDEVKFRVFILDEQMKPFEYYKLKVSIQDPEGHKIYNEDKFYPDEEDEDQLKDKTRSKDFRHTKFIYQDSYKIPEQTYLGSWNINVDVDGTEKSRSFEVKEHVSPHFEVHIDTDSEIAHAKRKIEMKIYAKYNFEEYVKGTAKMTVKKFWSTTGNDKHLSFIRELGIINETLSYNIDLVNDLKMVNAMRDMLVTVEVEFKETATDKIMRKTSKVIIRHDKAFNIRIKREERYFKQGFPYKVDFIITNLDGSPAKIRNNLKLDMKLIYKLPRCVTESEMDSFNPKVRSFMSLPIRKGTAQLKYDKIPQNLWAMEIEATLLDQTETFKIKGISSLSNEYIRATVENPE